MKNVSREEMRNLDKQASVAYGIPPILLMENAGRGSADLFAALHRKSEIPGKKILILCGKGNNGGDALVAARHLWNRDFQVVIFLACEVAEMSKETQFQFEITQKMKIPTVKDSFTLILKNVDAVIDGLYGIGLNRSLAEEDLSLILKINHSHKPVLALDIPSGMDADTGLGLPECIHATWTATFGLPKKGFDNPLAQPFLGELLVVDIGLPKELLE